MAEYLRVNGGNVSVLTKFEDFETDEKYPFALRRLCYWHNFSDMDIKSAQKTSSLVPFEFWGERIFVLASCCLHEVRFRQKRLLKKNKD